MPTSRKRRPPAAPTGLQAQAEAYANEVHQRRLRELDTLAPLLARLDELVPALAAQRLTIHATAISQTSWYPFGDGARRRLNVLRLRTDETIFDKTRAARWYAALLALGLQVVSHDAATSRHFPTAVLRKGPLLLEVDLAPADAAALLAEDAATKAAATAAPATAAEVPA